MANSVDPDQTAPTGAVCCGSTLFASILNSSLMLGNYLQQTTFSDAFFSWRLRVNKINRTGNSQIFPFFVLGWGGDQSMSVKYIVYWNFAC